MISFSKRKISSISKVAMILFFVYFVIFVSYKVFDFYKNTFEKQKLEKQLKVKTLESQALIKEVQNLKKEIKRVENLYPKKEEIEQKVKKVFERMSILDYDLRYVDAKTMCVDRHILITQLIAQDPSSKKAGLGILSYIGQTKKSDKEDSIYFVDYIAKPKDK